MAYLILTAEDVAAIKGASRFGVSTNRTEIDSATLSLVKVIPARNRKGFSASEDELRREINVNVFDRVRSSFYSSYINGAFQALRAIVRPGDSLIVRAARNNNGYLDAAEIPAGKMESAYHGSGYDAIHHDCLFVSVVRDPNGKRKTIVADLQLLDSIAPDNSARAIQPTEYTLR